MLKVELVYNLDFKTIEQAKTAVFEHLEIWYNRKHKYFFYLIT
ncbi:IS3 family transposase [Tamlana crocina]|uniref:IS3 family transposase n=1 Tax=Tamlana crocina TaxID=393006 RepID=A0ABX1DEK0_9FLAO|nr:IS3 family transposase [Tamlana crocina]